MTLALRPISYFTRLTRAAMLKIFYIDYIRAARAKGLTEAQIIWRHALPNAPIPVVTMVTLWLASLLGGSVMVEVIFAIPEFGRIIYNAVIATDASCAVLDDAGSSECMAGTSSLNFIGNTNDGKNN